MNTQETDPEMKFKLLAEKNVGSSFLDPCIGEECMYFYYKYSHSKNDLK